MNQRPYTIEKEQDSCRLESLSTEEAVPAFETIVRKHSTSLIRFVYSRVRSRADAEDICQETFLKAFQAWPSFDHQSSPKTWLFAIAYHEIVTFLRKKKSIARLSREAASLPSGSELPCEESGNIWDLAKKLPEDQYALLWLKYKEELSVAEIAKILCKSRLNVRVMLHRARCRLAKQMNGRLQESSRPCSQERKGNSDVL